MGAGAVKVAPKLTPWFPRGTHPVHAGVYETRSLWETCFQYWNGKRWSVRCKTAYDAAHASRSRSAFQMNVWRGLAAEPAKAEK